MTAQAKTTIEIEVPSFAAPLYRRGWTVNEAARAIGCSAPHLRRVLEGERTLSAEKQAKLDALPTKRLRLLTR